MILFTQPFAPSAGITEPSDIPVNAPGHAPLKILFMGYISKAKGAVDLIKCAPRVLEKAGRDVEFNLCGEPLEKESNIIFVNGPDSGFSSINDFVASHSLERNVFLRGVVSGAEKERLFAASDIFVLPSYSEGCPISLLEAMEHGLPVVATRVGAVDEMLEEKVNCLFVRPGETNELADSISALLSDPALRSKMGQSNKDLIKSRYSRETFIKKLSVIFQEGLN